MVRIKVQVDTDTYSVDRDDVLAWAGRDPDPGRATEEARAHAAAYVRANPRPERDAQGAVNTPARQRRALLRRLAAGPATRTELLAVMRRAAGYVGGDDWRNRMDELRGRGRRGGGHPELAMVHDEPTDTYRLTESFPHLSEADRAELGRVKGLLRERGRLGRGRVLLDGILPDVPASPLEDGVAAYPSQAALGRLDRALYERCPVELRYRPEEGGAEVHETVLPLAYLPGGTVAHVHVSRLDDAGERVGGVVLPLDRVVEVGRCTAAPAPGGGGPTTRLVLWVTEQLWDLLRTRPLLDLDPQPSHAPVPGLLEVRGTFDRELSWELLRVLLRWAGSVRVVAPDWLAAAYTRRCLEGLVAQLRGPPGPRPAGDPLGGLADDLEAALEALGPLR